MDLIAGIFRARYGDGGSGFVSPTRNILYTSTTTYQANQVPVVNNGFTANPYVAGGTDGMYFASSGAGQLMSFYARGTNVTVYYFTGPSPNYAAFTVAVDGTVVATITPVSSTTYVTATSFIVSSGEHTVEIKQTGSSGAIELIGVAGTNSNGVVVDNMSFPDLTVTDLAAVVQSGNAVANSGGGYPGLADLLIIELGLNDIIGLQIATNLVQTIQDVLVDYQQHGVTTILLIIPNGGYHSTESGFEDFRGKLPAVAASNGAALIDFNNVQVSDYATLCAEGFHAYSSTQQTTSCESPGTPSTSFATCTSYYPSNKGYYNMAYQLRQQLSL